MLKEVAANRHAWGLLAKDQYERFRQALSERHSLLNRIITSDLGDLNGRRLIHLQCNTGADTVSLARLGATVTGVDLVPENVAYARRLAEDCGIFDATFIESDIMSLQETHHDKYDIVFTSEGALCWLPDLRVWAATIRQLLRDDGFFYVFDGHPFYQIFDETTLASGDLTIKYPYFSREPDRDDIIGGYTTYPRQAESYCWNYSVGDVINSLIEAGLRIRRFNEYDMLYYDLGGMEMIEPGLFRHERYRTKLPFAFSLKATL